ncbi:hypothetical protein AQUCO_08400039v1 [Aquilegia coerulea]|uniref:Fluoride ion transporter CrcB n=1 Tax=Aquilegia coerulea TaxID=218851 RepID=A0A2G5C6T5_AQUCA|nr:hypothetical protein AQUCO_08400039v1 [Aquilegia coerulea]PIA26999.1 hypothetical protein AQUCO_08400039v1 [Aquilegia coerulea]
MESSGRNDDSGYQFGRDSNRNNNLVFPQDVDERSASQLSVNRNNNNHTIDIGIQRLSSDRMSSVGGSSRRRHSLSFPHRVAPEFSDDEIESEVVSQAGDIGDRQLNSNRYSESGSPQSSIENFMSVGDGVAPINEIPSIQTFGSWSRATNALSKNPALPPLQLEIVSLDPEHTTSNMRDKDRSRSPLTSIQNFKERKKELPCILEYISSLLHLAVFGILGVFTRYLLQKLFGPQVAGVTSDETLLYLDLPSNMVGSFLMGWLGVVFKGDISRISDLLAIGLTTGYLGSLTTFSGWNQKMLDLSVRGRWVHATLGIILGLGLAAGSIRLGILTAKGFRWLLNRFASSSESESSSSRSNFRINTLRRHIVVLVTLLLILGLLWVRSGNLLRKWFKSGNTNGQLWLACLVGPPGVWARWFLARLNGRGLGRNGSMKWIPFGTVIANVSAACVMASLATMKKVVNTENFETIATGIQFGFLGCLSTVSTFIAEFHAMLESKHPWRAFVYAAITLLPSFIVGTLIYSVPVWTKGYQ